VDKLNSIYAGDGVTRLGRFTAEIDRWERRSTAALIAIIAILAVAGVALGLVVLSKRN